MNNLPSLGGIFFSMAFAALVMMASSPVFAIRSAEIPERAGALLRRHAGAFAGARAAYKAIWRNLGTTNAGTRALAVGGVKTSES